MQLPILTLDEIRRYCSERSFERGYEYYEIGAIGNPVRYGYTLWADCEGSGPQPYRIRVQLMPSGVAQANCSCPYRWDGYCKHIVALLLTYLLAPETVTQVDTVLRHLESQPTSHAIHVLAELLQRAPELVPVARYYAYLPQSTIDHRQLTIDNPCPDAVYAQQMEHARNGVDALFGAGFLETEQVYATLQQLNRLKTHAQELAVRGEPQLAQIVLLALIQTCIGRYEDTPKRGGEIPRFVRECATRFAEVALAHQLDTGERQQQLNAVLELSFRADRVFTAILTHFLQQVSTPADVPSLERRIQDRLHESPSRRSHIRLLLGLYTLAHRIDDYLTLARQEGEGFLLAIQLLERGRTDEMWEVLGQFPLSAGAYWHLLHTEAVQEPPDFETRLLTTVETVHPPAAAALYQRLVNAALLPRKRRGYRRVRTYLLVLKQLYTRLGQAPEWTLYLTQFRQQHARKRALLEIIKEIVD